MSTQNNTNIEHNNSFQANIQQPHGPPQNPSPHSNYYIGNNTYYYYGDQRQFHLRGPPHPAAYAHDDNAEQLQGGQPLRLSGVCLDDINTTNFQVEYGFSSSGEHVSSRGLSCQPKLLSRGNQHPPSASFAAGFQRLYTPLEGSFASHRMASSYRPTNALPWYLPVIDHQNDHRDLEEHRSSEYHSGRTSDGHDSVHTAHNDEDVTYVGHQQYRQTSERPSTCATIEQTTEHREEIQLAPKNAVCSTPAPAPASKTQGPADVTSRKTNRKPKFQVLADVLPTPLPSFPQVQLHYPTRINASANFRERVKLQATYWTPPANDTSIPQNDADRQNVVRILVGAMKDLSRVRDIESQSSESRWVVNAPRKHDDEDIEIACWEIAELAERLHREGPSVLEIRDAKFQDKVKSSGTLTFQQRIHYIATMLCEFKSRCDGMIKGGSLHTVVGAPQDALHTSRSNLQNNRYRQGLLSFARKHQPEEVIGKRKRPTKKSSTPPIDEPIPGDADLFDDEHGSTEVHTSPSPDQSFDDTHGPTPQSSSEIQQKRVRFSTQEEMSPHSDLERS